jgi:hypothetical protein
MTYQDPHTTPQHTHEPAPSEPGRSWTSYAIVKYGFILIITIVVLYFVARYLLPLL